MSGATTFSYTLTEPEQVDILVFNSLGKLVAEPLDERQGRGTHTVTYDAGSLPAGIYFYRFQAGREVGGGKMIKW